MPEKEAREKIVQAVQDMLREGCTAEDITVRQIAARAGVGIGTVSYHFHSKEKLLFDAVGGMMAGLAGWMSPQAGASAQEGSALERLRGFLLGTAEMTLRYSSICSIQLSYELIHGDMSICYFITPLLKEHFGARKSDLEIKLIALELITAMQSIFLKMEAFQRYTGLDVRIPAQREEALDTMLHSVIKE